MMNLCAARRNGIARLSELTAMAVFGDDLPFELRIFCTHASRPRQSLGPNKLEQGLQQCRLEYEAPLVLWRRIAANHGR